MRRLFVFGMLLLFAACKNESHKKTVVTATSRKDGLLRVLTYGLSQNSAADAVIAKQYGFSYYPVTGCIITKNLLDSINNENNKVYQALANEYGANWKQQYSKKVDSLSGVIKKVKAFVSNQPFVQQLSKKHIGGFYYHIIPADTANIFHVQAFSYDANQHPYNFKVNLQTNRVELVK